MTHKVVPIDPEQKILTAMAVSKAIDDEGEFLALMDLIDFSGENKTTTVLKCAYKEAIAAAPEYPADVGWISVDERLPDSKEMIICARKKNDGEWALDLNYWTVSNRWAKEYTHWMPLPPEPAAK